MRVTFAANAHEVELRAARQTCLDVAQIFAKSHPSETHAQELIPRRKPLGQASHRVAIHVSLELLTVQAFENLGEKDFALIHPALERGRRRNHRTSSNHSHPSALVSSSSSNFMTDSPSVNWTPVSTWSFLQVFCHPNAFQMGAGCSRPISALDCHSRIPLGGPLF